MLGLLVLEAALSWPGSNGGRAMKIIRAWRAKVRVLGRFGASIRIERFIEVIRSRLELALQ